MCATSVASPQGTACLVHLAARHGSAGGSHTLRCCCRKDLIGVCRRGERQPLTSREVWLRDGQGPKSMSDGRCKGKHEGNAPTQCSGILQTKQIPYLQRPQVKQAPQSRPVTKASQPSVTFAVGGTRTSKSACLHPAFGRPPTSPQGIAAPNAMAGATTTPRRELCAAPRKAVSRCGSRIWPTPSIASSAIKTNPPPAPAASMPATSAATARASWPSYPWCRRPRHSQHTDAPPQQARRKPATARLFSPCPMPGIPHDAESVSFGYDHADNE